MSRQRKLTPAQVREARAWWKQHQSTPTRAQMARHLRVSETTLIRAVSGDRYREIRE